MEVPHHMLGAQNFPALIRELYAELRQHGSEARTVERGRWRARASELAMRTIKAPHEFLDWAKRDREWSFTLAEVMRETYARPSELAARLLVAMLERLDDERELAEDDPAVVPAVAAASE